MKGRKVLYVIIVIEVAFIAGLLTGRAVELVTTCFGDGTKLAVGDHVVIEGKITAVQPTDDYCNITVETDEVMPPGDSLSQFSLNAKQVTLCRRAEAQEES